LLDGAPLVEECLAALSRIGDSVGTLETMGAVAEVMATLRPSDAARLWGAIDTQRTSLGVRASPVTVARNRARATLARATLGDDIAFDRASDQGRAMSLSEAEQLTLACLRGQAQVRPT
jgi:hypothetical protein